MRSPASSSGVDTPRHLELVPTRGDGDLLSKRTTRTARRALAEVGAGIPERDHENGSNAEHHDSGHGSGDQHRQSDGHGDHGQDNDDRSDAKGVRIERTWEFSSKQHNGNSNRPSSITKPDIYQIFFSWKRLDC